MSETFVPLSNDEEPRFYRWRDGQRDYIGQVAAWRERDRLREILERLRNRMAEPDQPIIQWDAGTWIPRIDAALEGRE